MNKQSNIYTVLYIVILVVVVGTALAITSMSLKDRQQANADNDRRRQILASINITPAEGEIQADFDKYIVGQVVINEKGEETGKDAFGVNVAAQVKLPSEERQLPLYICKIDGTTKYIIPLYGAGLWGPIWGYLSLNEDGSTIYGAYFGHQGETPGLGAEITKESFYGQFPGKEIFKGGQFAPVSVVKNGQKPTGNEDYVNGISGGTITSKGVSAMLNDCLAPYKAYLEKLQKSK